MNSKINGKPSLFKLIAIPKTAKIAVERLKPMNEQEREFMRLAREVAREIRSSDNSS